MSTIDCNSNKNNSNSSLANLKTQIKPSPTLATGRKSKDTEVKIAFYFFCSKFLINKIHFLNSILSYHQMRQKKEKKEEKKIKKPQLDADEKERN
jgi:ATP adenylyltransferase/5',5'''-P-1,P-4-tetraphosphate phosphorylase II